MADKELRHWVEDQLYALLGKSWLQQWSSMLKLT